MRRRRLGYATAFSGVSKSGEMKGYLLKSATTSSMANQRMTTAATSVEVGAIPRATFEPPPGYKQVPAP
jgi:hypothetical protein